MQIMPTIWWALDRHLRESQRTGQYHTGEDSVSMIPYQLFDHLLARYGLNRDTFVAEYAARGVVASLFSALIAGLYEITDELIPVDRTFLAA
jgi:hypothetical protein